MSETIRIVQLYPLELGITGDRGNVRALQQRLERAGFAVEVTAISRGDELPAEFDILVMGNGPLSAMRTVLDDLHSRAERIRSFVDAGGVVLAVGASAELLSRTVTTLEGDTLSGLGILDATVSRTRDRKVGYIAADTSAGRVLGFEDYASEWSVGPAVEVLGAVSDGRGSCAHVGGRGELLRHKNVFTTNVQGPALPLNPWWSDLLIAQALAARGIDADIAAAAGDLDRYAAGARAAIEQLVHDKKFNSIGL